MLDLALFVGKTLLFATVLLVIFVLVRWYKQIKHIEFYERQGVTAIPGAKGILGNITDFFEYEKIVKEIDTNMKGPFHYVMKKFANSIGMAKFDAGKTPLLMVNAVNPVLMVTDEDFAKDFFTQKMRFFDKALDGSKLYLPYMGNGIILSQEKEDGFTPRKKIMKQGFIRQKIEILAEHIKQYSGEFVTETLKDIEQSQDKSTLRDITSDIEDVFLKSVCYNTFSEDILDQEVDFEFIEQSNISKRKVKLGKTIIRCFSQIMN